MAAYRQYENPRTLEKRLEKLKEEQKIHPEDQDIALEIAELKERINFAWQDDESESGYEMEM